jgi:hypothetical protein
MYADMHFREIAQGEKYFMLKGRGECPEYRDDLDKADAAKKSALRTLLLKTVTAEALTGADVEAAMRTKKIQHLNLYDRKTEEAGQKPDLQLDKI